MSCAAGPAIRTSPTPPRPGGVAIATIVSLVENIAADCNVNGPPVRQRRQSTCRGYFRVEMRTVFEKASPTLSVVTPGISATAMCTMRRSYGLSGPSC